MTGQIFISYSRADTKFVTNLIGDLTSQGLNVWMDQRNIAAGQRWDNTIQQALHSSDVFVIVLSPNSVASENVLDELSYAINSGKRIIPLMYRNCEMPYRIARIQFVDFRSDYQAGFNHLISEITQKTPQRPIAVKRRTNASSMTWILGGIFAFALCAALGVGGMIAYPILFPTDVPITQPPAARITETRDIVVNNEPSVTPSPTQREPTITPSPTLTPEPPHAPAIENNFGVPLFDEHQKLINLKPGEQFTLKAMEYWSAPLGTSTSCADGFLVLTWIVRDPYPTGGEDLQLLQAIPMGGGRTEVFASGIQGSATLGYCDEIYLFNNSLRDYWIEIRYASGTYQQ